MAEIGAKGCRLTAVALDLGHHTGSLLLGAMIVDADPPTRAGKIEGDGAAYPAAGARHQRRPCCFWLVHAVVEAIRRCG